MSLLPAETGEARCLALRRRGDRQCGAVALGCGWGRGGGGCYSFMGVEGLKGAVRLLRLLVE